MDENLLVVPPIDLKCLNGNVLSKVDGVVFVTDIDTLFSMEPTTSVRNVMATVFSKCQKDRKFNPEFMHLVTNCSEGTHAEKILKSLDNLIPIKTLPKDLQNCELISQALSGMVEKMYYRKLEIIALQMRKEKDHHACSKETVAFRNSIPRDITKKWNELVGKFLDNEHKPEPRVNIPLDIERRVNIPLDIEFAKVKECEPDGILNRHSFIYIIECKFRGYPYSYTVKRKYSEFSNFYKQICSLLKVNNLSFKKKEIVFPCKRNILNPYVNIITSERKKEFDRIMKKVVEITKDLRDWSDIEL